MKTTNLKEGVLAVMAAIVLTSTAVGAAVGPARALESAPVIYAATANGAAHV